MDCKDTAELISPYLDGELEPERTAELTAHLQDCADCARALEEMSHLSQAVARSAPRYKAPETLRARIADALAAEIASESTPLRSSQPISTQSAAAQPIPLRSALGTGRWRPLALAASFALAIVMSSGVTAYLTVPSAENQLVQDLVDGHIRSLMASHLTDVVSSDQHTVKPWFHGRIDLAPPVDDLAADGYRLVGGRIDYIDQRPVAALVYEHGKHPINLFVLPASTAKLGRSEDFAEHGYNVVHWTHGDMALWAVSDLNLTDLKDFKRLYEARSDASAKE
ncbi:MAG: anti-sigma factor [Alphaproteobacteria bacterium]|nr:anti-sigma factor [Alphaproteobacteria bacterium]